MKKLFCMIVLLNALFLTGLLSAQDVVMEYSTYLMSLDEKDPKAIKKAEAKFKELFPTSSRSAEKAFRQYVRYHARYLQKKGKAKADPNVYLMGLLRHYQFDLKHYYIFKLQQSKKQPAVLNGKIKASWKELAEAITSYEKFYQRYPNLKESKEIVYPALKEYAALFLVGTKEKPIYIKESGQMDTSYMAVFDNFIKTNRDSEFYPVMAEVHKAYLKLDKRSTMESLSVLRYNNYKIARELFEVSQLNDLRLQLGPVITDEELISFTKSGDKAQEMMTMIYYLDQIKSENITLSKKVQRAILMLLETAWLNELHPHFFVRSEDHQKEIVLELMRRAKTLPIAEEIRKELRDKQK